MGDLGFDLRDAARSFRRDRWYAATVIATLALTIGATTAIFSIVNGILLKPLPFYEANRLVALREIWRELSSHGAAFEVNERHFEYWHEHSRSFESMAQYVERSANLTGRGEAEEISVVHASGSIFHTLQAAAALGRTLGAEDEPNGAADVATITDSLWRRKFGADSHVVGSQIVLDGKPYTVVGVLPAAFRLPYRGQLSARMDAFVPLRFSAGWVGDHNNEAIGRLRAGVTMAAAAAELNVLETQVSQIATREAHETVTLEGSVTPLAESITGKSRQSLLLLLGAIGAVLLIACSNLANLAVTRGLRRQREEAIRAALGASRARLVAKMVLEQLLLSLSGGALGIWVAWAATGLFIRMAPVDTPRLEEVTLDFRVLLFAATISVVTGLLVAMAPAWRAGADSTEAVLRGTASGAGGRAGGGRRRAVLLALQVTLSVTLLFATALFSASFVRVMQSDRGFQTRNVFAMDVALPAGHYGDEKATQAAYDRLLAAVAALPGVDRVSTTSLLPLRGAGQVNFIAPQGSIAPAASQPSANFRFVAPQFFATLGIRLLRGRFFTDAERAPNRPTPAVISEPAAERLWPGQDAVGKRFSRGLAPGELFEVVGVAVDAHTTWLDRQQPLMVYVPYWWRSRASTTLLIRTANDRSAILQDVRRAVQALDSEIAIGQAAPMRSVVDAAMAARRYQAQLFTVFGLAALFIAALGVYAVTSYGVALRNREINIRLALGARNSQVTRMVLWQGTRPVVAGLAAGAWGAAMLGSAVASLLFEVKAHDPEIMIAVLAMVAGVALLACGLAVRRGMSADPAAVLQQE